MSGCRHNLERSSLFKSEREILDRSDAGVDARAIADELGLKPSYVKQIVSYYSVSGANPFQDMARAGSAALLEALRRHHPECCRRAP